MKHRDPYREAKELYEMTIESLDRGIRIAMRSLFDNGDLAKMDRKVYVVYGIKMKDGELAGLVL